MMKLWIYFLGEGGDIVNGLFLGVISEHSRAFLLGECLLISSLPGKASRTLVDIARLAERFNMRSRSRAW